MIWFAMFSSIVACKGDADASADFRHDQCVPGSRPKPPAPTVADELAPERRITHIFQGWQFPDLAVLRDLWNRPWVMLGLCNLFWAGNIIVGRVILGPVPAVALSFWRWVGAFAVALCFAWPHLKKDWRVLLSQWKLMFVLAATGIAFFNTAAYIGLSGTTALNVLLLQSCLPLIVTIWAFALFNERPSVWQLAGIGVSLAGVAIVAAHGRLDVLRQFRLYPADLWILASAVIYGIYIVLLRRRLEVHPLSFIQVAMGLGACMLAPIYLWELSRGVRMTDQWQNYAGIVYMAVFPSFLSYMFFNRGVQLIGSARAGQSTHLMPLFGSIMAVLFLGETLHLYHLAGAILIGAGLVLAQLNMPALLTRWRKPNTAGDQPPSPRLRPPHQERGAPAESPLSRRAW